MHKPPSPVADIAFCVAFFTRLPMVEFEARDRKLGDAIWAAPLAGLLVAIIGAFVLTLASAFGVPRWPAAALALAATMLATGCLHEDGLADVADGFGGGKTQERKLEIMRDSRLGTYGAAALMLSVLARWSALAEIGPSVDLLCALIAAHVGSRAVFAQLIRSTPLATQSGLAATVGPVSQQTARLALGLGGVGLLFLGLWGAIWAAVFVALVVFAFRALCLRQVGGLNGDTLGAAQQLAEITILITASAIFF
ncbi:MAG: adenosylcobinamide-GDP ribazoletransferase [Rhizobiaceae bacterium]